MDVETTQIAAACLGIGTATLCRRQKKRRQRKIWVKVAYYSFCTVRVFDMRAHCPKHAKASRVRKITRAC